MNIANAQVSRVAITVAILTVATLASTNAVAKDFTVDSLLDFALDTQLAPLGSCLCRSEEQPQTPPTCTLRAAIQASNACNQASDLIELDPQLIAYRITIVGSTEDAAATGDLDIVRHPQHGFQGSKTVTINMNGQIFESLLPGGSDDRLFDVPASEDAVTVNISNGLLRDGETLGDGWWSERGGCVRALAGTFNLDNVNFQRCYAYFAGGAIYVEDVDLSMTNCNLGDNELLDPGPDVDLYNPAGGALAAVNSFVDIQECHFLDNGWGLSPQNQAATQLGGAIYVFAEQDASGYFGELLMDDTVVEHNLGVAYGGGVALYAPAQITNSKIVDNEALDLDGVGAGLDIAVPDGYVYVADSFIEGNTMVEYGGGLAVRNGTLLTVERTSIAFNWGSIDFGGGAFVQGAEALFSQSGFADNRAGQGGALYIGEAGEVRFVNVSTSDNSATGDGGAVYNYAGSFHALHSTFFSDLCNAVGCTVSGIYAELGTTNELDRSILLADPSGMHCDGPITPVADVMSDTTACFWPSANVVLGDEEGMALCYDGSDPPPHTCPYLVVTVEHPSNALEKAKPCGSEVDALGQLRKKNKCDIGAYEDP